MNKLITEQLKLKDLYPDLAQSIANEHGIKEEEVALVRKGLTPADVKFEEGERAAISYITTNTVDRDMEIVDPKGAMLKDYKKNPVVLFGHNYHSLPIGKNEWIKSDEKGLIAKTIYAEHEEADKVYQYRKAGFPLAESIGFIPIKFRDLDEAEQKANGGARRIYDKWILLEYSDVAVPSNPQATEIAISKGLIPNTTIDNSGTTNTDFLEVTEADIINNDIDTTSIEIENKLWEDLETEIRYRLRNPELFELDSFRRIPVKRSSPKINGIAGKLKGESEMTLQSLRFSKDEKWTLAKAQEWVKAHPDIKKDKLEDILLKMLQDEEQKSVEKEGRVLSQKNRTLVKNCIEVLNKLYSATEPEPKKENEKKEKYNTQLNDLMNQVSDIIKKVE